MIPVYLCTGLLDSGKTSFIRETLMEQDWIEEGRTLLILCEEGEIELDEAYLRKKKITAVIIEEPEQFTPAFMREKTELVKPRQIVIEFNGMWNLQEFLKSDFPKDWGLAGIYSTVDGQTVEIVMNNMRNLFMNQLIESDLIVVNRCAPGVNRAKFRKAIKLQNPNAQLIFEAPDGSVISFSEEDLPYDISKDELEIQDIDYGTWYADAFENPGRYLHKRITFLAQLFRPVGMPRSLFVPGRQVMACCAADIRFYGFPCRSDQPLRFEQRSWATVTAEFSSEKKRDPRTGASIQAPVLRLISLTPAEKPENEVVTL